MGDQSTNTQKAKILVADDTDQNREFLQNMLTIQGYEVFAAENGRYAVSIAKSKSPDLILMDVRMPELDGYQACKLLQASSRTRDIPIIFVSALDEVLDKVRAFDYGAVDYITKPIQIEELLVRINTHLTLRNLRKELEEKNALLEREKAQLQLEIDRRKQVEEKLKHIASTDPLTNVYNRRYFFELAKRELALSKRYRQPLAIVLLDIDHFKSVNDTYGHKIGDDALIALSALCKRGIRETDLFARYGGEEFIFLFPQTTVHQAKKVAERLRKFVSDNPFKFGGHEISITLSVGVAGIEDDPEITLDKLFNEADQALYHAKQAGRNQVIIFSE